MSMANGRALWLAAVMTVTAMTVLASGATWEPGIYYARGAVVTYGGPAYTCRNDHTSQTGWEPGKVPLLWAPLSADPTPTPTPGPKGSRGR